MDGPGLDPRGMTETRAGGGGQTPPQGPCDPLEVRNPKPQPSSGASVLFQFSHPRPIEAQPLGPLRPSPGAPVPWAVQPTSQRPRTPRLHCQPASNTGLTHHSETHPGTPPQKAFATRPQGCLGRPRTTRSLSPNFALLFRVHLAISYGHQGVSG